jgi:hypothetical protein
MFDVLSSAPDRQSGPPPTLLGDLARILGILAIMFAMVVFGVIAYVSQFTCSGLWVESGCRYRGVGGAIQFVVALAAVGGGGFTMMTRLISRPKRWWTPVAVGAVTGLVIAAVLLGVHQPWN